MRRIGTIAHKEDAERFRDYLLTLQVQSQVESAGEDWALWVYDEDQVESSREELERYRESPRDERYQQAIVAADRIRHEKARKTNAARKKQVNLTRYWNRPLIRQIPVTLTLVVLSVVVTLGTQFGANLEAFGGQITMVPGMKRSGDLTSYPTNYKELPGITDGQIWRLVTPAFLHFDVLHLLMDLYMFSMLGSVVERVRGSRTLMGLFFVTAIAGNLVQLYFSGPAFGGMSGVVLGVFGYMWIKGQMDPGSGLGLSPNFVFMMMAFLLFMTFGFESGIAHGAHMGGLASGMGVAAGTTWWRRLRSA
ncbi:MAG: rhomboid family intramembrane serine protease [Planctomycetaceae bacterium]